MLQDIFDKQEEFYIKNGYMEVDKNLPPVAGALRWINKVRQRIMVPTEIVKELELA
jgi:Dynein heavy chain, N-terminal region 1.